MYEVEHYFLENNFLFVFSSEAMEERYEYKTHARIQDVVRITIQICIYTLDEIKTISA